MTHTAMTATAENEMLAIHALRNLGLSELGHRYGV